MSAIVDNWFVGQKVRCIRGGPWPGYEKYSCICWPEDGRVYTVRGLSADPSTLKVQLFLDGIDNPVMPWRDGPEEPSFGVHRFRPLVSQDADISVFTEILDRVNERVPVKA